MSNKSRREFSGSKSMLDLYLLIGATFIALFLLAVSQMAEQTKKESNLIKKAEFLVKIEWDSLDKSDIDLYVRDPMGRICYFQAREVGLMHLERDDRGWHGDRVDGFDNEEVLVTSNEETIVLRGILPGEYTVNAHMYSKRFEDSSPVKAQLEKINPYQKVVEKSGKLENNGDEITLFRFTLSKEGDVTNINNLEDQLTEIGGEENVHP